ncbi:hypothetical protein CPC08DRAFT_715112 [Agrocybe pediades]|nr:hypothetical protein CPC08DRAFT_715112 [Agrocybe pediades]
MSSTQGFPSSDNIDPTLSQEHTDLARLKNRLAALEDELAAAKEQRSKPLTPVTMGRGVPKLISMFESIQTLVTESDRRLVEGDGMNCASFTEQRRRDRTFQSYKLLTRLVPDLEKRLETGTAAEISDFITSLQRGAVDARGDDIRRIREELSVWLNEIYVTEKPFSPKDRDDRGMGNDITGRLLCPITLDWDNEDIRFNIREKVDGYAIDNIFFVRALYPMGNGDPDDVTSSGWLRSSLLVRTYCALFTSPSSANKFEAIESESGPVRKKHKSSLDPSQPSRPVTKANVATLLRMEGNVTPRSIAYAAVLLVFNLTDAKAWPGNSTYNGFDFVKFYNLIIDSFEGTKNPDAETIERNQDLLAWWNKNVFHDYSANHNESEDSWELLKAQRAVRVKTRRIQANAAQRATASR